MIFLITGVAGFLGSSLANQLAREGHQVRGIDDLSAGDPDSIFSNIHFTRGSVNDRPKLWTLLQDVDCVYHLAARVSVPESVLYPSEYNQVNVGGTVSLMEAMRDVGVRRVVFISSGAVYGSQKSQPLRESLIPKPDSPYAVSKLSGEFYVNTIGNLWGIETVILRVFNAYGPGQRLPPSHPPVIPNFLKHAVGNGTLVVHGDGNQTRDYIFVDDLVRGMIAAATAPDVNNQVINIGSGTETSIRELAELIIGITESKAEIIYNPRKSSGVPQMRADVQLSKSKLGFKTHHTLSDGLALTLERDNRFHENR